VETGQAVFFEDNDFNKLKNIDLEKKRVCSPCPTIQEIVISIRRRETFHDGPKSCSSGPQPNGDLETNDN
jgi:hypothetical protein